MSSGLLFSISKKTTFLGGVAVFTNSVLHTVKRTASCVEVMLNSTQLLRPRHDAPLMKVTVTSLTEMPLRCLDGSKTFRISVLNVISLIVKNVFAHKP